MLTDMATNLDLQILSSKFNCHKQSSKLNKIKYNYINEY